MDANTVIIVVLATGVVLLLLRVSSLAGRLDRLSRVEGKLDALLKQQGVEYDPLASLPAEVQHALDRGERILAIKRLREATGLGLKDAKEQIDEVRRRRGAVAPR